MRKIESYLGLGVVISTLCWPAASYAYNLSSKQSFELLPSYCKAWYTRAQRLGKTDGYRIPNPSRYNWDLYRSRIGEAVIPMNHYCPALQSWIMARYPYLIPRGESSDRKSLLLSAKRGIHYLIEYNNSHNTWKKENMWLLSVAYTQLGDVERDSGNHVESINEYKKALDVRPDNVTAYFGLAKAYEELKLYDKSISALEQALRYRPKSSAIERKIKALKNREK